MCQNWSHSVHSKSKQAVKGHSGFSIRVIDFDGGNTFIKAKIAEIDALHCMVLVSPAISTKIQNISREVSVLEQVSSEAVWNRDGAYKVI